MTLQERIQNWLGITSLRLRVDSQSSAIERLNSNIIRANNKLDAVGPGLGRVIAKLDAKYATSEFDPTRRAESDKLAEETIKRLEAEAAARAPYNDPN